MDEREFYIFGLPVQTDLGEVRFLTYMEYMQNIGEISLMKQNVLHLYYQYKNHYDAARLVGEDKKNVESALAELKNESLFNFVHSRDDLRLAYIKIFSLVIDNEETVNEIMHNENLFMNFRKLVLDMNITVEDEVSPNEEIQKGIEISRKISQQKSENQSFVDIVTSIVASTNNSFQDVCKMSIYQVYAIYTRVGAIFNYQTSTLFATVSEQTIESWSKHIDLFANESGGTIKRSEFDKKFGKLL